MSTSGESDQYTIETDHPSTISQQLDDCEFRPLNPRSRPTIDIASPSDCRFRWFHSVDLRSLHHFRRRGSFVPHFSNLYWPRSCYGCNTSGKKNRGLRKLSSLNFFGTVSHLCPRLIYLFLLVSMSETFHPLAHDWRASRTVIRPPWGLPRIYMVRFVHRRIDPSL